MSLTILLVAGCTNTSRIENQISKHAMRVDAHEYQQARIFADGALDDDGEPDSVVVYSLEPREGNYFHQYLAVRSSSLRADFPPVLVGGKDFQSVTNISIEGGTIHLGILRYDLSDASCCPSVPANAKYQLTGLGLQNVR
jgi:hypothetical protein